MEAWGKEKKRENVPYGSKGFGMVAKGFRWFGRWFEKKFQSCWKLPRSGYGIVVTMSRIIPFPQRQEDAEEYHRVRRFSIAFSRIVSGMLHKTFELIKQASVARIFGSGFLFHLLFQPSGQNPPG